MAMLRGVNDAVNASTIQKVKNYAILDQIGKTNFGKVYKAERDDGLIVAIKELENYNAELEKYIQEEIDRNKQNLNHVNIVKTCEYFKDRSLFIVMEHCELGDLNDYMVNHTVDEETRIGLMTDMARGVNYLHSKSIVHRDLKPENILITKKTGQTVCKISDLGISKTNLTRFDKFSTYLGSPAYMAPEMTDNKEYSNKVDVYALGLIYFAVYTNAIFEKSSGCRSLVPGFNNDTGKITFLNDILKKETPTRHSFIQSYFIDCKKIGELIYCMLETQPDRRPEMGEVVETLLEWQAIQLRKQNETLKDEFQKEKQTLLNQIQEKDTQIKELLQKLVHVQEEKVSVKEPTTNTKPDVTTDDDIDLTFRKGHIVIERKPSSSPSTCKKPHLSARRWQQFTENIKPVVVKRINIEEVNLKICHKEMFHFLSRCENTEQLLLIDITDENGDNMDILKDLTKVFSRLVKLRGLDIWDTYLGENGAKIMDNITSPDLRVISLYDTHLTGSGKSLVSCLSHLPLLSYLGLSNSGLSKVELIQVLQVLPESCPNILYLKIDNALFSSVEMEPVFLLNHLRSLSFSPSSSGDLIEVMKKVPKTLSLLHLEGNVGISNRLQEFISAINTLPRLRFLVVHKGCLDSEGEQKVSDVLKQTGGRFVIPDVDPKGWDDYQNMSIILKNECFKDS